MPSKSTRTKPRAATKPIAVKTIAPKPTAKPKSPAARPSAKSTPKAAATRKTPVVIAAEVKAPSEIVNSSKQSQLISLLKSASGATVDQMMKLTGWQAHSVRGTISGVLRKRLGYQVICSSSLDGASRLYRIAGTVAPA